MNLKLYKASAGSGKTYRLAYEYVLLLFRNRTEKMPHRLTLAVTFTNKATDEMKRRIVRELYALANEPNAPFLHDLLLEPELKGLSEADIHQFAQKFLIGILYDYSGFNIATIDRFFQQIVRAFTREIGLQSDFAVELDQDAVLQMAIDNMLHDLDRPEKHELLGWLKKMVINSLDDNKKWSDIYKKISELGCEIFKEAFQTNSETLNKILNDRTLLADYQKRLKELISTYEKRCKLSCERANKIMAENGLTTADFKNGNKGFVRYFNHENLKKKNYRASDTFYTNVNEVSKWYIEKSAKKAAIEAAYHAGMHECAQQIADEYMVYNSAKIVSQNLATLGILNDIDNYIGLYCSDRNAVLLSSSNEFLRQIIAGCDAPFIYEKTGINLRHFMIDEFQDTSNLQWQNFRPLIANSLAENNQNLIVGDIKQSIYRWRNSDWRLLQSGVNSDFGDKNIDSQSLSTNWRSAKRIVEFNNRIFELLPKLSNNTKLLTAEKSQLVQEIYANARQNPHRTDDGRITLELLPYKTGSDTNFRDEVLKRLPTIVQNYLDHGYRLSDITVLVRMNFEASKVAATLLKSGYEVVSNEALLVSRSPSVQLLTAIMQFYLTPEERFNRLTVETTIARIFDKESIVSVPQNESNDDWCSRVFGKQAETIISLRNRPLFQMVEGLIFALKLNETPNANVYLQAFQDEIFSFANSKTNDLGQFLEYWATQADKRCLSASETQNAIRILTVHKSKGLEFKAVIIPFCDWQMIGSKGNKSKTLWCRPQTEHPLLGQLPIVPVKFSKELGKSVFDGDYQDEKLYQFVDTLNLAYVAFTRAESDLYIIGQQLGKKTGDKPREATPTISHLLEKICEEHSEIFDTIEADADELITAQIGTLETIEKSEKTIENASLPLTYDSVPATLKFRRKYETDSNDRRHGVLMHSILSDIRTTADLERALKHHELLGEITKNEHEKLSKELGKLLQKSHASDWFSGKYRVLNETEILCSKGKSYRPDRVMIDGEKVVVVDYKFGTQKSAKYRSQVANYMQLISEMGYCVSGYIWYIALDEIEQVTN